MPGDEAELQTEAQHPAAKPAVGLSRRLRDGHRIAGDACHGSGLPVERDVEPAAPAVKRVAAKALVLRPNSRPAQRAQDGFGLQEDPLALRLRANHAALPVRDGLAQHLLTTTEDGERDRRGPERRQKPPREGMRQGPGQLQPPSLDLTRLDDVAMGDRCRVPGDRVPATADADPSVRPAGEVPDLLALDELVEEIGAALGVEDGIGHDLGPPGVEWYITRHSERTRSRGRDGCGRAPDCSEITRVSRAVAAEESRKASPKKTRSSEGNAQLSRRCQTALSTAEIFAATP